MIELLTTKFYLNVTMNLLSETILLLFIAEIT